MIVHLTCADCGISFEKDIRRGFAPKRCPECTVAFRKADSRSRLKARYRNRRTAKMCLDCGKPETPTARCKECAAEWGRRFNTPAQANARYRRAMERDGGKVIKRVKLRYKLRSKYGLTIEAWEEQLTKQDGVCAICQREDELQVDHCHTAGNVRGLLCGRCNKALGLFDDKPEILSSAARYLLNGGFVDLMDATEYELAS